MHILYLELLNKHENDNIFCNTLCLNTVISKLQTKDSTLGHRNLLLVKFKILNPNKNMAYWFIPVYILYSKQLVLFVRT